MTIELTNKVLEKDENFMLANAFDGFGIISYLQFGRLVKSQEEIVERGNNTLKKYILNTGGDVTFEYNKSTERMRIIMSKGISAGIAENIRVIGEQKNYKRFGKNLSKEN